MSLAYGNPVDTSDLEEVIESIEDSYEEEFGENIQLEAKKDKNTAVLYLNPGKDPQSPEREFLERELEDMLGAEDTNLVYSLERSNSKGYEVFVR